MKLIKTLLLSACLLGSILNLTGCSHQAPLRKATAPLRYAHTTIYDPTGDRMILFGGTVEPEIFSDLWQLDLKNMKWQASEPKDGNPLARYDHSAVYDPKTERMILFGGKIYEGDARVPVSELWELDLKNMKWKELETGGDKPPARCKHTAIFDPVACRMIIHAGKGIQDRILSDLWELDLKGMQWKRLEIDGAGPSPRSNHTAIYDPVGQRMILFGGEPEDERLWELDLKAMKWREIKPEGDRPQRCREHTAVYRSKSRQMVVVAGEIEYLLWSLDLEKMKWEKVDVKGDFPPVEEEQSAIYEAGNDAMIVFGGARKGGGLSGLWKFDFNKAKWEEIK